jgi:DNA-binding response OmpR family regulator
MVILVIDDDPAMTDLLTLMLEPIYKSVVVSNHSTEGVEMAKKLSPDLIILDLMMPEMNGWDACLAIRKFSAMPILMLSALDNPNFVARALNAGADDFLVKPVACNILVAHINKLTRRLRVDKSIKTNPAVNVHYQ